MPFVVAFDVYPSVFCPYLFVYLFRTSFRWSCTYWKVYKILLRILKQSWPFNQLLSYQPVRSAYQPPANSTFLSERISHQQPAATSQQYSSLRTNQHQPSATSQPNRLYDFLLRRYRSFILSHHIAALRILAIFFYFELSFERFYTCLKAYEICHRFWKKIMIIWALFKHRNIGWPVLRPLLRSPTLLFFSSAPKSRLVCPFLDPPPPPSTRVRDPSFSRAAIPGPLRRRRCLRSTCGRDPPPAGAASIAHTRAPEGSSTGRRLPRLPCRHCQQPPSAWAATPQVSFLGRSTIICHTSDRDPVGIHLLGCWPGDWLI
jgi:hypothetical protein